MLEPHLIVTKHFTIFW